MLFAWHLFQANRQCTSKPNNPRHVRGAAAKAEFLSAAKDLRFEPDDRIAATHKKRSNAFGAIDLMSGKTHQVEIQFIDVDHDLADRLSGIAVQQNAALPTDHPDIR